MGWATVQINKLKEGKTVYFRPRGDSMVGIISSGQLCTVTQVAFEDLKVGDVVLCKVNGNEYLHKITAIKGNQAQIANSIGFIYGWANKNNIFGKLIKVED